MNSMLAKWKSRDFLLVILFLQLVAYAMVFFDVPVARQVVGSAYLIFVPGFVIIKLLKLDELGGLETVLFSVGLSVAFLMLAGLFVNEFCFLFGVLQPLSLMPLMIILNGLVLTGGVLIYLRGEDVKVLGDDSLWPSPPALLFICLPILSVIGAMWVNAYGKNSILLFMIIAIALLFTIGVISKKLLSPKAYSFAVLMIALALLYHSSLISNYIVAFGSDVPIEYFVLKTTENTSHWSSTFPSLARADMAYGRINAMLSVTILPTVYSSLLNMDATWIFKILFPLIFSSVPVALYQVWQTYVGRKYAFISTFLFMAQSTFYTELLGLNRQMIAELFFVLLLLVVLNKKMKHLNKMMLFMIFSFALVTSHYALAEIFLFFISFALIPLIILKRPSKNITVNIAVFFFVIMFTWYIYTSSSSVFESFLQFGDSIYQQLGEFSNPASRGQTVLRALGVEESPSILNSISRTFAYITQALIVVGVVGFILKRTKTHFDMDYFILCSEAMVLLGALILVPGLANTLNMTRFYHILLFFLGPFCVLGAETLTRFAYKRKEALLASFLLIIVLVPYFLFQTGFVYEVTRSGVGWSIPLSGYSARALRNMTRMNAYKLYYHTGCTDAYSVYGAQWVSQKVDYTDSRLYADYYSTDPVLIIYGNVYFGYVNALTNVTKVADNGVVYLSALNIVVGKIAYGRFAWNFSEFSFVFDGLNTVYSNGGSEVYTNKT
jgi:uncharacterized membrane protein